MNVQTKRTGYSNFKKWNQLDFRTMDLKEHIKKISDLIPLVRSIEKMQIYELQDNTTQNFDNRKIDLTSVPCNESAILIPKPKRKLKYSHYISTLTPQTLN